MPRSRRSGAGSWRRIRAGVAISPPAWLGSTEGVLAGEIMPGADSMWGNLQPALAYAVQFGVPGAKEGYERMTGAQDWPALRDQFSAARPVSKRRQRPSGGSSLAAVCGLSVSSAINWSATKR